MAVELVLTPELLDDVGESARWYDGQENGLGDKFVQHINACLDSIAMMPTMHEKVRKNYRRALVRRFPYAIYYAIAESSVIVYAAIHTARHPNTWRERLP
jgi:plasmid stabilization system protein ParE